MPYRYRNLAAPLTLLAMVALLVVGAWWGYQNVVAPPVQRTPAPCITQSVGTTLTTDRVSVKVLNGGTKTGLAGTVAKQLRKAGFDVTRVGNTDRNINKTVVEGSSPDAPEVLLTQKFFKNAIKGKAQYADGTVTVYVGNNFGGMNNKAPKSIEVPGGSVCLPSPEATPTPGAEQP